GHGLQQQSRLLPYVLRGIREYRSQASARGRQKNEYCRSWDDTRQFYRKRVCSTVRTITACGTVGDTWWYEQCKRGTLLWRAAAGHPANCRPVPGWTAHPTAWSGKNDPPGHC